MVPLLTLWLPILLSAILVFVVSFLVHTVFGYHRDDFRKLPNEDAVMTALRGFDLPRGDYIMPWAGTSAAMKDPEYAKKRQAGPVAIMTVLPSGSVNMGGQLALWFASTILVGLFAAYLTSRALGPGAPYLEVFRFAGTTAFMGYSLALLQESIWHGRNWRATLLAMLDGLIYGLLTAGVFGWLWPD